MIDSIPLTNIVPIILDIAPILIAIVTGYAGYVVNRSWTHRHQVDYFKEYYSMLTKNRFVYSERMMEVWISYCNDEKNKNKQELRNVSDEFKSNKHPYLIIEKNWEYPDNSIKLDNVFFYSDGKKEVRNNFLLNIDPDPAHKKIPKLRQKVVDEKVSVLKLFWGYCKKMSPSDQTRNESKVELEYLKCKAILPQKTENHVKCIRRYAQKTVFNGDVIAYEKIMSHENNELHILTHDTDYYNYLNYLDLRALYIVHTLEENSREKEEEILHRHLETLDPLDTSNRPVAIGISSLCIFENIQIGDEKKSFLFVHHRSGNLAEAMNTISLVPAGSLTWDHVKKQTADSESTNEKDNKNQTANSESTNEKHHKNCAALSTVIREFEEEILGKSNVEYTEEYTIPEVFSKSQALTTYFLGMGLDPLTTKMEMIAKMVFHCDQDCTDLKEYFSKTTGLELSPGANIGYDDVLKLSMNASSEGDISIIEIEKEILMEYQYNRKAMPVFKEGIRLLLADPEFDEKYGRTTSEG